MKITIQGQDYTTAFDAVRPLTIERKLNEPSVCQLWLSLPRWRHWQRQRAFQSLAVTGDDGTTYFTGYIAVSPLPEYAGMGLEGPRYRTAIQAVSDEILLDQVLMPPSAGMAEATAGTLLASLVAHTGSTSLSAQTTLAEYASGSNSLPSRARTGARAPGRRQAWRGRHIAR